MAGYPALDDQRRQRDVVADREAVDRAGRVDHQRRLRLRQHGDGNDLQEAERRRAGFGRSMTKPSTTRSTSAAMALIATARRIDRRSGGGPSADQGTRWVRKPTCEVSTKANGAEIVQKCHCRIGAKARAPSPR